MAIFGNKKTDASEKKVAQKKAVADVSKNESTTNTSMKDLYSETAPKVAKTSGTGAKAKKNIVPSQAYRILVKPLVTEKAANLVTQNKYVFVVSTDANKIEVAKAIEALYGIKPEKVNLANVSGKKVTRGKIRGQRKDWRKAVVTLPKGQTIKIYEGV